MRSFRSLIVLVVLTAFAAPALAGSYVSGGTFVVKTQFGTLVDNGGVVCHGTDGGGIGGGCLPFPGADGRGAFVRVADASAGDAVAFQVCIDNNGDGICGGPAGAQGPCFDQIFFSHDDEGRFFNALGPLPTSFLEGCAVNGGFPGYVVLLCTGAHEVGGAAHSHTLTQGTIGFASTGSGYGSFCGGGAFGGVGSPAGGPIVTAAKAYTVV